MIRNVTKVSVPALHSWRGSRLGLHKTSTHIKVNQFCFFSSIPKAQQIRVNGKRQAAEHNAMMSDKRPPHQRHKLQDDATVHSKSRVNSFRKYPGLPVNYYNPIYKDDPETRPTLTDISGEKFRKRERICSQYDFQYAMREVKEIVLMK